MHASVVHSCRLCCSTGDSAEGEPASAQVLVDGYDAGEVQRVAHLAQQRRGNAPAAQPRPAQHNTAVRVSHIVEVHCPHWMCHDTN